MRYQRWARNGKIKVSHELVKCCEKLPNWKCITHTSGTLRPRSRRAATSQEKLIYKNENWMHHERFLFVGDSIRSFTELPLLNERIAETSITDKRIWTGGVQTNVQFLQCGAIQTASTRIQKNQLPWTETWKLETRQTPDRIYCFSTADRKQMENRLRKRTLWWRSSEATIKMIVISFFLP